MTSSKRCLASTRRRSSPLSRGSKSGPTRTRVSVSWLQASPMRRGLNCWSPQLASTLGALSRKRAASWSRPSRCGNRYPSGSPVTCSRWSAHLTVTLSQRFGNRSSSSPNLTKHGNENRCWPSSRPGTSTRRRSDNCSSPPPTPGCSASSKNCPKSGGLLQSHSDSWTETSSDGCSTRWRRVSTSPR